MSLHVCVFICRLRLQGGTDEGDYVKAAAMGSDGSLVLAGERMMFVRFLLSTPSASHACMYVVQGFLTKTEASVGLAVEVWNNVHTV